MISRIERIFVNESTSTYYCGTNRHNMHFVKWRSKEDILVIIKGWFKTPAPTHMCRKMYRHCFWNTCLLCSRDTCSLCSIVGKNSCELYVFFTKHLLKALFVNNVKVLFSGHLLAINPLFEKVYVFFYY